jgi:hypothetical protein
VRLDASYVTEAVQLGYVSTDYGSQGVTSNASITLLSEATSAGGLYVGVTRGRFENQVHVVAEDDDDARAKLIAAPERERADRGLDVARSRAEADSLPVSAVPHRPSAEIRRVSIDPASWRSAAELDRAERAIEAALVRSLRSLRKVPLVPDEERERQNRNDREKAAAVREEAARHRGEAERLELRRDELVRDAGIDYFAARDDARVIAAGPGLLHHRSCQIAAAWARRDEIAARWREPKLPDENWHDDTVSRQARDAAARMLGPVIRQHLADAVNAERRAAGIEAQIAWRERSHARAASFNGDIAKRREELMATAAGDQAAVDITSCPRRARSFDDT